MKLNDLNPRISVIIPVLNGEATLKEAIDSILKQTLQDFEIIIINDGSIDQTKDIIEEYTGKSSKIKSIEHSKNQGLPISLNEGIRVAKGKYIARMDGDDIAMPERFEKQVQFMEDHPEIGLLGTAVESFGDKVGIRSFSSNPDRLKILLFFEFCFEHPTLMFRKELVERYHLYYDESLGLSEDLDLCWRFSLLTKIANLSDPLVRLRQHSLRTHRVLKDVLRNGCLQTYKNQVKDFGVTTSSEEFDLYSKIRLHEDWYTQRNARILGIWFQRIIEHNSKVRFFSPNLLREILANQWFSLAQLGQQPNWFKQIRYITNSTTKKLEPRFKKRLQRSRFI